jgi:hypothetical protein
METSPREIRPRDARHPIPNPRPGRPPRNPEQDSSASFPHPIRIPAPHPSRPDWEPRVWVSQSGLPTVSDNRIPGRDRVVFPALFAENTTQTAPSLGRPLARSAGPAQPVCFRADRAVGWPPDDVHDHQLPVPVAPDHLYVSGPAGGDECLPGRDEILS